MLPVVLQLSVRFRSHSSSHSRVHHVSHSPGLSVPSGLGRMVVAIILLLLIMSGDIETNPGPVGQLKSQDLSELIQAMYEARAKWYRIGVQLKLSVGTLNAIRAEFSNTTDCLTEMCSHWLRHIDPYPSWVALIGALESPPVGEGQLALQLRDKYCRGGGEMVPHVNPTPGPSGALPTSLGPSSFPVVVPLGTSHPATVTTPAHQPGPSAPVQHHPPSHEATPQEGSAAVHPNTICYWYSQPQPESPVQQYTHLLPHTNAGAPAPNSVDYTHLTPNSSNQSQVQLPTPNYPHQDSRFIYVDPSQYPTGYTTLSCTPTSLPVPPSQFSISNVHHAVHSQPTRQDLNPASPHVASYTGQPHDTRDVPRHGFHHQYPTPLLLPSSITRTQPPPAPLSQPHQGRFATDDHPYSYTVQPGLGPSYLAHLYPSTSQHSTLHSTQSNPQLPFPLPVPPSQFYRDSSISHVHPQPAHRPLKSVSPHVPSCTGQPQVHVPTDSIYGCHSQSLIASPPQAQTLPVSISQPHELRSADDYHPHTHAMQPGLARPSHPSALPHCWPAHHPAHQTALPPRFQPHATHSFFSPAEGSSHVHTGELENSSAAKRQYYSRSVYVDPYTLQGVCHKARSSLSPAMTKYAQYLRGCYARSPLPENSKFPPSPSVHYINLAYILRRTMSKHESEEFKVAMVRGEIDQIAREKGLDFSHVAERLPDGSYPQIVLVEGAPGVGKTTFAWEFCKKWGKGELKQEYSLVILLRLRDKRMQEAKCLRDLFYHPDETLPDVIAEELINSLGEGVLILLEGLDELPEHQRSEPSVFLDLIHSRLLPLATVLITTRPWASEYLHNNCKEKISQHVEILGFTKQQVNNYLQSVCKPDDDPSLLSDIEKYLSCYPQIHAAMYIPLNAAIVVEVYRRSRTGECIIPKTMTQLYTALSQALLIRYLKEHLVHKKIKWKIQNFSDLPPDVYEHFLQLSKVAYNSIINDQKLIFSSEDLPNNLDTLGFMQSVPELYVSESFSHNFLHLTIQEYLAAVYITHLSTEEQLKHFEECGDGLFEVVMRFVAGLSKFSGMPLDSLRALFLMPPNDPNSQGHVKCDYAVNLNHANWMFETRDPNTINAILGSGNTIEFDSEYGGLVPFDYYCLGYCIAHSHCQWKMVFADVMRKENVNMLSAGGSVLPISKQNSCIVSMNCCFRYSNEAMVYLFSTLPLHICVELQELIVETFDPLSLIRIVTSLSLKVLELIFTEFTAGNLRELCDLQASTFNSLEVIKIRKTDDYYDDDQYRSCMTIEGRYQQTSFSVDICISSVDDVTSTVSVLKENSNLGLHITALRTYMDSDQVCRIAKALHDTTTTLKVLKAFDDVRNPTGIKAVLAIAKLINNNKSLEDVEVSLGCLYFFLKELDWRCVITVGEFRELCDDLLASTSSSLEIIKIRYSDDDYCYQERIKLVKPMIGSCHYYHGDQSFMTIEGRYQHTSVSVDVHISSVDDVTSTVSVLTENSNLGLHITALRMWKLCESINGNQACKLAKALRDTTALKKLEMVDHPIGTEEAMAIIKLIRSNKSLEILNMIGCSIDSEVACHLAQALRDNTTLRNLDLSCKPIQRAGAISLAGLLHTNTSVQTLKLSHCAPLGEEDTYKLLEAMTVNSTVQHLILPKECEEYAHKFPKLSEVWSRVSFL